MTRANTMKWSEFFIELGDGASPENFAKPCGANTRGIKLTKALNETNTPDCADEDAASYIERDVVSNSGSLDFAGVVDKDDLEDWLDFFQSTISRSARLTAGTKVFTGKWHLSDFELSGERGKRVSFTAALQSDGEITIA
jgi:hypothetical protein